MLAMQPQSTSKIVSIWLFLCLVITVAIMVISGTTRLLESGLSIMEWRPLNDLILPVQVNCEQEFKIYKALPQFQKAFPNMEIEEFVMIYTLEYIRHVTESVLLIISLLPLLWFSIRHTLRISDTLKLSAVFAFASLHYLSHFYIVKNALLDDPHFTPYRLSLQLALQFIFFGLILWQLLSFSYPKQGIGGFELPKPSIVPKVFAVLALATIFLQIILGGAVSGLHAGLSYNTFPRMDNAWIPEGLWSIDPWYKNLFEDATTAQFMHRMLAYGLSVLIPLFWLIGRTNPHIAHLLPILFSIFVVQFLFGVLTLLFVVPIPLSSMHQANAILVFGIAVTITHRLFIPIKTISYDTGNAIV